MIKPLQVNSRKLQLYILNNSLGTSANLKYWSNSIFFVKAKHGNYNNVV